jgi:hypothetical protein
MAMIKSARASGANTVLACWAAAATSTAAIIPVVLFNARPAAIVGIFQNNAGDCRL